MPIFSDPWLDCPFDLSELQLVLKNTKENKAPGNDRISYEFYKNAPQTFLIEFLSFLNHVFLREEIPNSFRSSIIIPLYKKGDINSVSNYRGLTLLDTSYKIFTGILLKRIESWLIYNNVLNEYQAGFRKGYSTIDNIFNLTSIVKLRSTEKKKTFAFFVDFSCAFDLIPRNSLFYKLSVLRLSSKLIRIISLLYLNTSSQVWNGSSLSDKFSVEYGVKQGCLLSPILFSLYLNDIDEFLPNGVKINNNIIKILLYADDLVILAESADELQFMINKLYDYCSMWSLNINLSKSKVLVFRDCSRLSMNLEWHYGNENIQLVNEYKYLGITLTYNLSFNKHLNEKLEASKMAINANWLKYIHNPKIKHSNKMKIFNTAACSIMFYGAQVWGFCKYEQVEKLFRYFIKKILYLPSNTPNYMLHLETRIDSLFVETLKLHFNFILRVLQLPSNRLPNFLAKIIKR